MGNCLGPCGLLVLESQKPKVKALADSVSGESPFLVHSLLAVSSHGRGTRELSGVPYKGTDAIQEAPPSGARHPRRPACWR